MEAGAAAEEFITIVPVGEGKPAVKDSAFVTVLTVSAAAGAAEVVVQRPRGARLGLGLKFEGGSAAAEKVRRLLVQSCAEDSPAANTSTPWGKLIPGNEILAIDGVSVSDLTRIDCVRRLKDSDETLKLLVRHFDTNEESELNKMDPVEEVLTLNQTTDITIQTTLPPPVPPRKLSKKNSFKDKQTLQTVGEQNALVNIDGHKQSSNDKDNSVTSQHVVSTVTKLSRKSSFDSHIHRQNKEGIAYLKKGSPDEVRRLVRRLSDGKVMPSEAEVYIDLLSNEWERCLVMADAESDDTGSSISTVVDRLGSMASSVENSIPSTPIMQHKSFDIHKVLNCIENIDSNILKDMTNGTFLENEIVLKKELRKLECHSNGFGVHENTTPNTQIKDETLSQSRKQNQINDRNNNYPMAAQNVSRKVETSESLKIDQINTKQEMATEKPKPMPRNTKVERSASERKRKPIPLPETFPPPVPEPLLTPTKKTCIETWLQRSEAEMNNKDDKFDESIAPEVLPRLIDFVPKSQFKENTNETPVCTRPTTAPPPPPVETREDGSGASLDTIGELDESGDVTDSAKNVKKNETKSRKPSFERSFWEDRIHKSDAEDKSLSNDEIPLPTCPRQPPDGVETPSDAIDKAPDLPSRLPPRLPSSWVPTRPRLSYLSRTQDARSEASVKDKIAMFSTDLGISSDHLDKCGTLPIRTKSTLRNNTSSYTNSFSDVSTLDRRLTKSQDNLDDTPRSYKRHSDRPEVLGALVTNNIELKSSRLAHSELTKMPLFYGSTTTLPTCVDKSFSRSVYHTRSVSDDTSNKNVSTHKLEHIIEQRKKSMSKLRGLVIPEVQTPIVDLPEIKVKDSLSKPFIVKCNQNDTLKKDSLVTAKSLNVNENKWKTNFLPNNIPKYSPAFKRKSLQVYSPSSLSKESTPERKLMERIDVQSKIYKPKFVKSITSTLDSGNISQLSPKDYKNVLGNIRDYKNVEIKICTTTDIVDSDNESAMSSAHSSYRSSASSPMHHIDTIESDSSRLSPRILHYTSYTVGKSEIPSKSSNTEKNCEEFIKRKVCRSVSSDTNISLSSSAGSAATSGSQASCSSLESSVADSNKRKVSRTYNVDTINRRNILASAKCRSGRDINLKSPVVEAKFSHESFNRSPSPTLKSSERLSTLTSSVSAITNKGENRRRNKIIAESDSDTDDENHTRQRKTEYKTSRLKRNSSTSSKSKQSSNNLEASKIEEEPKYIKEKNCQDVIKTGIQNESKSNTLPTYVQSSQRNDDLLKRKEIDTIKEKKTVSDNVDVIDNITASLCYEKAGKTFKNKKEATNDKVNGGLIQEPKIYTSIIRLKKGVGSGVGLILAGGIDCEAKDVTVHRVLADSVAAKAGLKRGAKVRSINGYTMMGLTHAQSVTILKEQRSEVVIEIENETATNDSEIGCGSENAESKDCQDETKLNDNKTGNNVVTVILEKAGGGTGLGFGLDGGRDSPQGDRPLTIKKLFAGGAAAQSGRILVGAELLSAGGQSMETFTRTQAWAALKSLPVGPVALVLRNSKGNVRA